MGIANTTASAALISVFTDTDPAEVTGRGTGINDETLARKTEVVRRAIDLHQPDPADPIGVLAAVGGFEHAAMVGLLLGGASLRTPVILDGVSATPPPWSPARSPPRSSRPASRATAARNPVTWRR